MSPLNRKLTRDLWRMKGQAIAISVVISLGVLMLVMMDGLVNSLEQTKQAYYDRYRLAGIFAPVKRAPNHILQDLANIPGVSSVEGRVSGRALISIPHISAPISAQALSLPDSGKPRLNDIYLVQGREIDPIHADEIILLQGFANFHGLKPGDKLIATMNGVRRVFHIVGLAQSPEFLYSAPPGEITPDDERFAVIWLSEAAISAAYDMKGSFNEALLSLSLESNLSAILTQVNLILEPFGGIAAYGLEDHVSNRFIHEEIDGLRVSKQVIPPIFLLVSAFLLYMVVSRMIQAERQQIGLLKAFGYTSTEIGFHYSKFILTIALKGALLGCVLGVVSGRSLLVVYQIYYKFPFLLFQVDPASFIIGFTVSIAAASIGGLLVLRTIFALTPAVAMQHAAPADFSRAAKFNQTLMLFLDQPSRMILRRIARQPGRAFGAIIGIAAGMALSVATLSVMRAFDYAIDLNFTVIDRSDAWVSFIHPLSNRVVFDLKSIDGIIEVEPIRTVPVVFRNGVNSYRGEVNGLVENPRLNRALNKDTKPIPLQKGGIILATSLAETLGIHTGELLTIDVREGNKPTLQVPVVGTAETLLGSPSYMEIEELNRSLKEPNRVSGAYMRVDSSKKDAVYNNIKEMPAVIGVSIKTQAIAAFKKLINTGAGVTRFIMTAVAAIITFGIIYNSARIAFAERLRDLASLRVIGFTKGEVSFILLGELAILVLFALPLGSILGHFLSYAISQGFSTDLYRVPVIFIPTSFGQAGLAVFLASIFSGWFVKRDIDRIDFVSTLKTLE